MKYSLRSLVIVVLATGGDLGCRHRPAIDKTGADQRESSNLQTGRQKMSDQEWLKEHQRIDADLWVFREHNKLKQGTRGEWTSPPTTEEEAFYDLWYFYSAALVNNADVSSYVPFMIEKKNSLEAIGAVGCLAALDQLLPLYTEQQKLPTERDREEFWRTKERECEKAHALAEDANDFGRLLLAYAERNSEKFGGAKPSAESRARYEEAVNKALQQMGIDLP